MLRKNDQNCSATSIPSMVGAAVDSVQITDIHTHLFSPAFGDLLLWGIDEVLTYHYLVAEFFRVSDMPYDQFWALSKQQQADAIWRALFIERSPLSEACRGVVTVLNALGLDITTRALNEYRAWYAAQKVDSFIDVVFKAAGLKSVVMTNDPFDPVERPVWEQQAAIDPRFHAALRIDPMLNDWPNASEKLKGWGYAVDTALSETAQKEIRRFLSEWITRMKALYMAVSLPPDFAFPEDSARAKLIEACVLPVAREHNIPFAVMIGVKRQVNPALKLAGDGVDKADVGALERLCAQFPQNKFMATFLSRENQHTLSVTTRKFRNLLVFGCWWFLNNPSFIREMTRMRMELLGPSFIPQHSDARVLDQVIYKWTHSRAIIKEVLSEKYADLAASGWQVTQEEIQRDAEMLLGGNFWSLLAWQM